MTTTTRSDMVESALRRETSDGVVLITIDRPERRNAMSMDAWVELRDLVRGVQEDSGVRGLLLTGAGDRAFAAGADIRELIDRDPVVALDGLVQATLKELEDLPIPTVAAMNGHALGGGWELALACDLRVASSNARVGFPEVGLGIIPGAGGTQRVLQHVGLGRAKELVLAGRILTAHEALDLGMVTRVVEPERVLDVARELLSEVLESASLALRLAKTVLNETARHSSVWELERFAYALTLHSPERVERMRSFLDKGGSGKKEL